MFIKEDSDHLKLIDFGSSKIIDDYDQLNKYHGEIKIAAPEVIGKRYGKKADIWAVGVMMYYLMTTFYPFEGDNDEEISKKIVNYNFDREVIKLKSDYSDDTKDLIFKLLIEDDS